MPGVSLSRLLGPEDTSVTNVPCDKFIEAGKHIINDIDTDFFKGNKNYEKNRNNQVKGIGSASGVGAILNKEVP